MCMYWPLLTLTFSPASFDSYDLTYLHENELKDKVIIIIESIHYFRNFSHRGFGSFCSGHFRGSIITCSYNTIKLFSWLSLHLHWAHWVALELAATNIVWIFILSYFMKQYLVGSWRFVWLSLTIKKFLKENFFLLFPSSV